MAKIQETARKMNVKVEFVKTEKDLNERMGQNGDDKPTLLIFDLNNVSAKPLSIIPKLKLKLKKATNIIGFVSHVQGELKMKAQEAGCDMVVPRSAFSQNLAQILRRHGAPDELGESGQ
jgi:DNA-binding NarL/FixJ family response regulator